MYINITKLNLVDENLINNHLFSQKSNLFHFFVAKNHIQMIFINFRETAILRN